MDFSLQISGKWLDVFELISFIAQKFVVGNWAYVCSNNIKITILRPQCMAGLKMSKILTLFKEEKFITVGIVYHFEMYVLPAKLIDNSTVNTELMIW